MLENYQKTDPHLLVGIVNTALRNREESLEELCRSYDIDPDLLAKRLEEAGYTYQRGQNAFR